MASVLRRLQALKQQLEVMQQTRATVKDADAAPRLTRLGRRPDADRRDPFEYVFGFCLPFLGLVQWEIKGTDRPCYCLSGEVPCFEGSQQEMRKCPPPPKKKKEHC